MSSPISDFDRKRFIQEIITNAGPDGITEGAIQSALEQFIDMNVDAAAITMWHKGDIKFSWVDDAMVWSLP